MITALKSCPTVELMVVACLWDIYPQYISILCTFLGVWALYTGRPERFPEGSDGVFSLPLGCNVTPAARRPPESLQVAWHACMIHANPCII